MDGVENVQWWRPDALAEGIARSESAAGKVLRKPGGAASFGALVAFTIVLFLSPQSFFPALARWRIALLAAVASVGLHVFGKLVRREPISIWTREMAIAACLALWAGVSVPLSTWPGGSASYLVGLFLRTLTIAWLLCNVVNTAARMRKVAWALALIGVPLSVTAVKNYLSGDFLPAGSLAGMQRIAGYQAPLTANPNDLALALNLIVPFTAALFFLSRRSWVRVLLLAMILLEAAGVIATFSRAGFLTLATAGVLSLGKLMRRRQGRWALAALALFLLSLPLIPSSYWKRLATITDIRSDRTGSAQARWQDMAVAGRYVLAHPVVGAGLGMNALALNETRGSTWIMVHNVYLEYAMDLGLPGLALFLALFATCLGSVRSVARSTRSTPGEIFHLSEGIEISLLAFALAACFHPVAYQFYFYYPAGLAVALKTIHDRSLHAEEGGGAAGGPR